jgi:hypothetical protein
MLPWVNVWADLSVGDVDGSVPVFQYMPYPRRGINAEGEWVQRWAVATEVLPVVDGIPLVVVGWQRDSLLKPKLQIAKHPMLGKKRRASPVQSKVTKKKYKSKPSKYAGGGGSDEPIELSSSPARVKQESRSRKASTSKIALGGVVHHADGVIEIVDSD